MDPIAPEEKRPKTRGVYFVANNRAYDQTVAFLNSFRAHNPDISLCLIPFNHEYDRIVALQDRFRFLVFDDARTMAFCDAVNVCFFPALSGTFRKLAMWNGIYDEFLYFDTDMVVLQNADFIFPYLQNNDFVLGNGTNPGCRKWTWKDSIVESGLLTPEQYNFAASTSVLASRKDALVFDSIFQKAIQALPLKAHMFWSWEQPFLNYLIVTSGQPYTSLYQMKLAGLGAVPPQEIYAGESRYRIQLDGTGTFDGQPEPILAVHWAGLTHARPGLWYARATIPWLQKLVARIQKTTTPKMPMEKLWKHYRNLNP